MTAPFAALEARTARAVFAHLANAEATLGGVPVTGIFDSAYAMEDLGSGIASFGPAFTMASSAVPSPVVGLSLVVNGSAYKVVEPKPDGTGVTVLRLRS
jgi:hypothetical protein